jgi:hypothetical protein
MRLRCIAQQSRRLRQILVPLLEHLSKTEIQHFDFTAGSLFDVCRLQVAMHDSEPMRRLDGFGNLPRDFKRFSFWNRPAFQSLVERFAFDEFQHKTRRALRFFQPIDLADVAMVQRRKDPRFPLKSGKAVGIAGELCAQEFKRDVSSQLVSRAR